MGAAVLLEVLSLHPRSSLSPRAMSSVQQSDSEQLRAVSAHSSRGRLFGGAVVCSPFFSVDKICYEGEKTTV